MTPELMVAKYSHLEGWDYKVMPKPPPMTTTITPGDLVLHNGRAEEVAVRSSATEPRIIRTVRTNERVPEDATRIGSTLPPENWRIHTGPERPEGVGADDTVMWASRSGIEEKRVAGSLAWERDDPYPILAYRIIRRAEPLISGQGGNCDQPAGPSQTDMHNQCLEALRAAQATMASEGAGLKIVDDALIAIGCQLVGHAARHRQVPASELRAVAEEIRKLNNAPADRIYMRSVSWLTLNTWADRISPREPEPLKVGGRVRWEGCVKGGEAEVLSLNGDEAWCRETYGGTSFVRRISQLERIP